MKTLKGPAIFLAQFMDDAEPFNNIEAMAKWAADLGFVGIQVPIGNPAFIDVARAAESRTYCDELAGRVAELHAALAGPERRTSGARRCA